MGVALWKWVKRVGYDAAVEALSQRAIIALSSVHGPIPLLGQTK